MYQTTITLSYKYNYGFQSKFEFIFGDVEEGRSFFPQKSEMPGEYLWPTNGIILNNALYIFCQAVSHDETGWFGISGTVIIKVKNKEVLNFCSNNYLGLSNHPKIISKLGWHILINHQT